MLRPGQDDNKDHGFSLDELARMVAAFRSRGNRPRTKPIENSTKPRGRPTRAVLEARGFRVLESCGDGFILPMGPSTGR